MEKKIVVLNAHSISGCWRQIH